MSSKEKVILIGDIHGRSDWERIVGKNPDADHIVFLGDYLDSPYTHDVHPVDQLKNFESIIRFKRENPDRVILLMGNHDEHYRLKNVEVDICYSRFQKEMVPDFTPLIEELLENREIQAAWYHGNYIVSHAGITDTWMRDWDISLDNINEKLVTEHKAFRFIDKGYQTHPSGDDIFQGPMWVRKRSLLLDAHKKDTHIHIVGHTPVSQIKLQDHILGIDALAIGQYLEIKDGNWVAKWVE